MIRDIIRAKSQFTPEENAAAGAILMQIQGALLALNYVSAEPAKAPKAHAEYIPNLERNTEALAKYLERKHRVNPKAKDFAALYRDAKTLSEQVTLAAPSIAFEPVDNNNQESSFQAAAGQYPSIGQALAVLESFEHIKVIQGRIIVITDLDRFLDHLSVTDLNTRTYWASLQGFILGESFPIYLNGKLLPLDRMDSLVRQGALPPAVYGLAGIIAHEYWHIQGLNEDAVHAKELALLARFRDKGLLGPDSQATTYIAAVEQRYAELKAHPECLIERVKVFGIVAPSLEH